MSSKEVLKEIVALLEEARIKHGVSKDKLDCDGKVTYANGNDGTSFDWHCNNRLCEFGYGLKDKSVWSFKLCINKNGNASVYCYPNGEISSVEVIERKITDEESMNRLYNYMNDKADRKELYDVTLDELGIRL